MKNLATLILTFLAFQLSAQSIIYVDSAASGSNNGQSWATAYSSLEDAIISAQAGNEIWVARGTYKPTKGTSGQVPANIRLASFILKDSVRIYGGFNGSETQKAQRDFKKNLTALSGNIGNLSQANDNVYHVLQCHGEFTKHTKLDGFTIKHGKAEANARNPYGGGGILIDGENRAIFMNLVIEKNQSDYMSGPAVHMIGSRGMWTPGTNKCDAYFVNCLFRDNVTTSPNFDGRAIYLESSKTLFLNCAFLNNTDPLVSTGDPTLYDRHNGFMRWINCSFLDDSIQNASRRIFAQDSIFNYNTVSTADDIYNHLNGLSLPKNNHAAFFEFGTNLDTSQSSASRHIVGPYAGYANHGGRPKYKNLGNDRGDTALLPIDIYDLDEDGNTTERINFDLDMMPRVYNGQVDMGAYEYRVHHVDTLHQNICPGDSFLWEGQYRLGDGNYREFHFSTHGFGDSIKKLFLRADSIERGITLSHWGNNFTSNEADSGSTYQWVKCHTNEIIAGATSRSFTPNENGTYKVIITNSTGCRDTSECRALVNIGLAEKPAESIELYPNPVSNSLHINCSAMAGENSAILQVHNSAGVLIYTNTFAAVPSSVEVNTESFPKGLYFLSLGDYSSRFVKN